MSHIKQRLALFKRRAFSWYILASFFASLGAGLTYISMTWMVVSVDDSVFAVVKLMLGFWIPNIILGPFAGVIADRFSRRRVIMFSAVLRSIALVTFVFCCQSHFSLFSLYTISAITGILFTFHQPAAMAFMREIVPEKDLLNANAALDIVFEIGNVVGMGAAGLIIAWTSFATTIVINSITFMLAALALSFVRKQDLCFMSVFVKRGFHVVRDLKEGFFYLCSHKNLIIVYTLQLLILVQYMTLPALLAPFAERVLHANVGQFGEIEASLSFGVIFGGIVIPWLAERYGMMKMMVCLQAILVSVYLIFSQNVSIHASEVLYVFVGFGFAVWPLMVTRAQALTALDFQGRVQGSFNTLSSITVLTVYLLIGEGGRIISIKNLYFVMVLFCIIGLLLSLACRREIFDK